MPSTAHVNASHQSKKQNASAPEAEPSHDPDPIGDTIGDAHVPIGDRHEPAGDFHDPIADLRDRASDIVEASSAWIRKNPAAAIGIAVASGFIVGRILRK